MQSENMFFKRASVLHLARRKLRSEHSTCVACSSGGAGGGGHTRARTALHQTPIEGRDVSPDKQEKPKSD